MQLLRLYGTMISMSLRRQLSFRTDLIFEVIATLIGALSPLWTLAGPPVAVLLVAITLVAWRIGLRNYSSATS